MGRETKSIRRSNTFRLLEALVMVMLAGGAAWPAPPQPAIGSRAPGILLADLQEKQHRLSDYAGKNVVLVQFWATWCPHCREALGSTKRSHDECWSSAVMAQIGG